MRIQSITDTVYIFYRMGHIHKGLRAGMMGINIGIRCRLYPSPPIPPDHTIHRLHVLFFSSPFALLYVLLMVMLGVIEPSGLEWLRFLFSV